MKHATRIICSMFLFVIGIPALALAGSATLHWQANTEPDLAGYRIYYGTSNNLTEGQTYYFALTAVDTSGNESGYSKEVSKSISSNNQTATSTLTEFVTQFYREALGRDASSAELNGWVDLLINGSIGGAGVARGFILSDEFSRRSTTNEEYVTILYRALLGRDPDQSGFQGYVSLLNQGVSRGQVLEWFIGSQEFQYVCQNTGIMVNSGGQPQILRSQIETFINKYYNEALGRNASSAEINGWVDLLINGSIGGADVARGFILSDEFSRRGTTNEEYVRILYRALLGRDPDQGGFQGYVSLLNQGVSRRQILEWFIGSQEFANVCSTYGIKR